MELHADLTEHWYILEHYPFQKLEGVSEEHILVNDPLENEKLILLLFIHD